MQNINNILDESAKLIADLHVQLNDTKEVIEAIKKGNIDAILLVNKKNPRVLVSRSADQSYRKLIQDMSEGIITLYSDGMILYANNSFARLVGLPLEKISGSIFMDFISPDHVDNFKTLLKDFPGEETRIELSMLNQEGINVYFIVSLKKIVSKELVVFNLVLTDITELKKKKESLQIVIKDIRLVIEDLKVLNEALCKENASLKEHITTLTATNVDPPKN